MKTDDMPAIRTTERKWPLGRTFLLGTALLLAVNSLLLYSSLAQLSEATAWVKHTSNARQMMAQIVADIMTAEAVQRTYLITGKSGDLLPYGRATTDALNVVDRLTTTVGDNSEQVQRLSHVHDLIRQHFRQLQGVFEARGGADASQVQDLLAASNSGTTTAQIRAVLREMIAAEDHLLEERQAVHEKSDRNAFLAMIIFVVTTIALIASSITIMRRELRSRRSSERQIKEYAQSLDVNVRLLEIERGQITLVNEMSSFLQSCNSLGEVADLSGPFFQKLFPSHSGAFRVLAASKNHLQLITHWGRSTIDPLVLPDDCWALRRGQVHRHESARGNPVCPHCKSDHTVIATICIPLQAFGETLGLLSLEATSDGVDMDATSRLATMVGRQLGLTLASLKARETLNEQSIRDPLTNAFNRRYLEVLATKEIAQTARSGRNLAIVMLDVDHFKKFNDVHGHQAGDAALVAIVGHLHKTIREGDWLFRYGGEEFLLLLRDTDAADALTKADELRQEISELTVICDGQTLPKVSVSMGISVFPDDAVDFDELVSHADEALYRAKREGRNRVCLAEFDREPEALIA